MHPLKITEYTIDLWAIVDRSSSKSATTVKYTKNPTKKSNTILQTQEAFKSHDYCNHYSNKNAPAPQTWSGSEPWRICPFHPQRLLDPAIIPADSIQWQHTHTDSHCTQSELPQSNCIVHHSGEWRMTAPSGRLKASFGAEPSGPVRWAEREKNERSLLSVTWYTCRTYRTGPPQPGLVWMWALIYNFIGPWWGFYVSKNTQQGILIHECTVKGAGEKLCETNTLEVCVYPPKYLIPAN